MDVDFYALKIQDHLKDETTYQKLAYNIDNEVRKKMDNMLVCFSDKEFDFFDRFRTQN